jgi:iron(III) transport system ATP-binding protein
MAYLELQQVTRRFGAVTAVDRLDLVVNEGECVAMLGPSGCGKTTTLRMVAGFDDLDEGEIRVGERVLSSRRNNFYLPPERRDFGMVFQAFAVWPHLSVFENVAFPLRVRKLPHAEIEARTRDALRNTNLLDVASGKPDALSGGGKQRVALARALAIRPKVMLLDEPLSSLDPRFREEMRFEIKDLQRRFAFSILYVTHDQSEAMALSDRILVMRSGVVQQIGTPIEIYTAPANRFVFEFIGLSSFLDVRFVDDNAIVAGQVIPASAITAPPDELRMAGAALLASRPTEVDFAADGGVPAVVSRKAFLGETVDYRMALGEQEVRVQKSRYVPGPAAGEACHLLFPRSRWYPLEDAAASQKEINDRQRVS